MSNKIYVKRRDNTGSFSDTKQRVFLVGTQNLPTLVEKTSKIESALIGRALIEIPEAKALAELEQAAKEQTAKNKVADSEIVEPEKEAEKEAEQTVEEIIADGDYKTMLSKAKELGADFKGNVSKDLVIDFLEGKISE